MPLIEVTTNRQISASIRLEEVTATQVDQYAAFIKASPDDVVDKALGYVFSKDRDFPGPSEPLMLRKQFRLFFVFVRLRLSRARRLARSQYPGWKPASPRRFGRHEPPSESCPVRERCCAPGKS